jgi:integrase
MGQKKTFTDAFELLLAVQKPKSPNTYIQTVSVEKDWKLYWARFVAFNTKHITRNGTPRRLGHAQRYLVMTLKNAQESGWIKKEFKKSNFPLNEAKSPVGKLITQGQAQKLLKALEGHDRTKLQVLMAMTMGMRFSEIMKLRKTEIVFKEDEKTGKEYAEIVLDAGRLKTRMARKVAIPVANDILPLLKKFYDDAKGPYIFPSERSPNEPQRENRHWWDMARNKSGVNCRFHDLRHFCASTLISEGYPTEWICCVLGMTQQVLSAIYAHMRSDDAEKFRGAFDGKLVK